MDKAVIKAIRRWRGDNICLSLVDPRFTEEGILMLEDDKCCEEPPYEMPLQLVHDLRWRPYVFLRVLKTGRMVLPVDGGGSFLDDYGPGYDKDKPYLAILIRIVMDHRGDQAPLEWSQEGGVNALDKRIRGRLPPHLCDFITATMIHPDLLFGYPRHRH